MRQGCYNVLYIKFLLEYIFPKEELCMNAKTGFKRFIALILSFAISLSAFTGLSLGSVVSAAEPNQAMHIIVDLQHTVADSDGSAAAATFDGYLWPDGEFRNEDGSDKPHTTGSVTYGNSSGKATITFDVRKDKDGKALESYAGFSVSAGHIALDLDDETNPDEPVLTITYNPSVRLVKVHVFYTNKSKYVAGYFDDTVSGTAQNVFTDEQDTCYGYVDSSGKFYRQGDEDMPDGAELTKYYSTAQGLHTDKTAMLSAMSDGRSFDLSLESWFVGDKSANVGLVLDASGSMANPASETKPITVDDKSLEDGVDPATGLLYQGTVDKILDKNKTDNTKLGVSGYSYYIFDPRSDTNEQVPIGYWDGEKMGEVSHTKSGYKLPAHDSLIGYYGFPKWGIEADASSNDADQRDWGIEFAKDNTKGYSHAYTVTRQDADGGVSFTQGAEIKKGNNQFGSHNFDTQFGYNVTYNKSSSDKSLGMLLEAHPSSGTFTLSFTVAKKQKHSAVKEDSSSNKIDELIYIGPMSATSNEEYYRIYRNNGNSNSRVRLNLGESLITNTSEKSGGSNGKVLEESNTATYLTYVFDAENGKVALYINGKKHEEKTKIENMPNSDINIILGGLQDDANGVDVYIDEVYVFDSALSESDVNDLYTFQSTNNEKQTDYGNSFCVRPEKLNETGTTTTPLDDNCAMLDDKGTVLASMNDGLKNVDSADRAGWYYVSFLSNYYNNYFSEEVGTSKELRYLQTSYDTDVHGESNSGYYIFHYQGKDTAYEDSFDLEKDLSTDGKAVLQALKPIVSTDNDKYYQQVIYNADGKAENSPLKFFVNEEGYLCCFYTTSNNTSAKSMKDAAIGWSYVYEKTDDGDTKVEALQKALGTFATSLNEQIPSASLSAVRFSVEEKKEKANGILSSDYDQLVLMDWTNDPKETNSILNLSRGRGASVDYEKSEANGIEQYNYGLTGGTNTFTGLQAYSTYLDKNQPADRSKTYKNYLVIFTDGKDTVLNNSLKNKDLEQAIAENPAYELAEKLREEGYTIFGVILSAGSVEEGSADYNQALKFLASLAYSQEELTALSSGGDFYEDDTNIELKDYDRLFSGKNTDELQGAFESILAAISENLKDYTVQDYIDPRFDLVDAGGNVIRLKTDGKISCDASLTIKSTEDEDDHSGEPLSDKIYAEIHLSNDSSVKGEGEDAHLFYDSKEKMYYLVWDKATIPSCVEGDNILPVWNALVTVRAKDDFIGGNAVLTNGNGEKQNYVYMNETDSSGTDNAKGVRGDEDTFTKYPSKGFPRTAVNIAVPTIEMPSGEQVIYMGEELTSDGVAEKLGEIIRDYIGEDEVDDPDYFNSKSWYWEYLMRYANYQFPVKAEKEEESTGDAGDYNYPKYNDVVGDSKAHFDALIKDIVKYGAKGIDFPYFYLPFDGKYQTGNADHHEKDVLGVLHFTWTDVDEGFEPYPKDGTTTDTEARQSKLTVTYTPVPISGSSAESPTGKYREDYNKDIVQAEKDTGNKSIYGWNSGFKPAPGAETTGDDDIKADGTFRTDIVKGEIVMFLELNKSDLDYLNQHNLSDTSKFIYSAKLNNGKTEIGTFVWNYTTEELAALNDYGGIIRVPAKEFVYANDFGGDTEDVKGLPIGDYTIELDSGPQAPTPFKFEEKIDVLSLSKLPEGITVSKYKTWKNEYKNAYNQYIGIVDGDKQIITATSVDTFEAPKDATIPSYHLGTVNRVNETVLKREGDDPSGKVIKQTTIPSYTKERYGLAKITGGLEKGSLKITKEVEDTINTTADPNKAFTFTVTLNTVNDGEKNMIAGEFTCVKTNSSNEKSESTINFVDGIATVSLKDGESITISDLPAGANYTIEEKSADGYTSSVESGEDSGTIEADSEKAVTFVNKYSAEGTATVKLEKEILGRVFNDSEKKDGFSFDIETADSEADYTGVTIDGKEVTKGTPYTVAVKENGLDVTFKFTKLGEYAFTIKEQENADDDLIEDPKVVTVTFKVTDPERNGKLNVETKYSSDPDDSNDDIDQPNNTITFKNKAFVKWSPTVTKTLNGRDWQDSDVFKFNMKLVKAEPKAVLGYTDENAVKLEDNPVAEATKDNTTAEFNEVTFYSEGTYTFEVSEVKPSDEDAIPGIDYDENKYTIIVTVGIDENTGRLTVKSDENKPIATFENNYTVDVTASVGTEISKELTGRDWLGTDEFTFELVADPSDEATVDAVNAGIIELPEAVTVTKKGEDVQFKNITFKGVVLDKVGEAYTKTYNFIIKEQSNPSSKGITYDTTTYPVEVKITLKDGTATAVVTANDAVTFENSYSADKTTWAPTVTKTLNGRDWQTGDKFTFELKPADDKTKTAVEVDKTVTLPTNPAVIEGNTPSHKATFDAITFTKAGEYTFTISEAKRKIAGITYDTYVYTLTVTVKDNNAGNLTISKISYTDRDNKPQSVESGNISDLSFDFVNTYTPKPVDVEVSVTKTLNGREWLNTDVFTFELEAADDATKKAVEVDKTVTLPTNQAVIESNTLSHKATFDAITFNEAGVYKFKVNETKGTIAGIAYDDTVYTVTVTVTDVGGQLTAKVAYSDNEGNANLPEITFTNTYTPDPVVEIEKTQAVGSTVTTDDLTVKPGDTVTYFLTVTNTVKGSVAMDVTVTDDIPEGLTLVEDSITNGGVNNGGTITWTIDKLEFNKPVVLSFSVKVPDEAKKASWSNFATVTYPNPDDPNNPNTDVSETVTINEPAPKVNPKVTVVKTQAVGADATVGDSTDKDLTVKPGDTVTYFLTVSASGGSEGSVAEGIKVTDKIPEGLKLVEGSITNGGENKGGIITWTVDVANGNSVVLSFKVTVPEVGEEPVSNTTRSWKNAAQFNGTDTNTVTVTENLGNLRITKRVSGNDGDRTEAFRFTLGISNVAISDTAVFTITDSDNKPVGSAEFVNGVCEFTLAHGQSLTVSGLPVGAHFEVKEIDSGEGYETTATVTGNSGTVSTGTDGVIASGTIAKDSTVTASFNNYRHKTVQTGSLTVRKTVASPNIDPDAVYTFNYTLTLPQYSEEPTLTYRITGIYGESGGSGRLRPDSIIPDAAGRLIVAGTFTLKHNQKIVISGIPVDTEYEVREDVPAGYILSTYKDAGTVSAAERNQTAVFVNTEYIPGSLTVSKTAIGSEASPWSFFDFVVTLYNDAQMTEIATDINGFYGDEVTYKGMLFENGVAYVTLSDGESCTATGLPGNLYYTVVETDNGEGYIPELAIPVGQTPLLTFNTPNVFDVPPAPDGTVVPDEPVADEPVADEPVADEPVAEPVVTGEPAVIDEPVTSDEPMPADEMSGEPVASEPDIIPDGTTTADEPVLPDETASDGNNIPFDLPMPIDEPAYGPTVSGAITPNATGTASFVNVKNVDVDVRAGELVIEKQVTGHGDREYGFGFSVEFYTDATFLTDVTADNYADIYAVVIKDTPGAETEGEEFVEISAGIGTFTLKDGESVCIGGIPDGTYFRVTEYDADGHTVSVTGDCMTIDEYSVYGTVSGDDSAHVIFNNNLPENHAVPVDATLKIAKSFSAPGATSRGDLTFNFTITEEPEGTSAPKTDRVTVYSGEDNPEETGTSHGITLSFPEAGTYTYSVNEEPISDDAGKYEGITTVGEPVEVVINVAANDDGTLYIASATVDGESVADTKLILVSFVNPYEPPATEPDEPEPATVELKIEKSFSAPGATSRGDLTFNFKVTKDTEESSTPVSVTVKKDAETGTSDDAVKLSFDAAGEYTYYVSEEPISDDADKYEGITTVAKPVKVVITVAANADGTLYIASATVDGEPVADTKLITVSFVNSYEPPATEPDEPATGSLTLSKVLYINNRIVKGVGQFRFRIELDSDFTGGRFSNGVAEVVLAAGESITLEGLPAGARYTVSEYNTYGYTLLVRESTGLSGTIPEDGEAKAAAVNVRVETWQPSAPPIGGPVGGEPPAETPEVEPPTEAGQTDEDGVEGPAPSAGFLSGAAVALMMGAAVLLFKKRRSIGK